MAQMDTDECRKLVVGGVGSWELGVGSWELGVEYVGSCHKPQAVNASTCNDLSLRSSPSISGSVLLGWLVELGVDDVGS